MARTTEFRRQLDTLFKRRTHWLRSFLEARKPGNPPSFSRQHVDNAIAKLQDLASEALAPQYARSEFERAVRDKRSWHAKRGKGHGITEKKNTFKYWYDANFENASCIYIFWRKGVCEYVGKTGHGAGRPSSHFDKFWFQKVTRIDVYMIARRDLPAIECLAIHRFHPARNKFKASAQKWTTKCPLCHLHRLIGEELRAIFRLR